MTSRTKRRFVLFVLTLFMLAGTMLFLWVEPRLWAKKMELNPGMNLHLATFSGLTADEAAFEAIHWNAPREDLTPRDRVKISVRQLGDGKYVARIIESPQGDSYDRIFYELTMELSSGTWKVVKMKKCWRGRGLWGWSTGIPS